MERNEAFYRRLSFWHDTVPGSLAPRAALARDIEADVAIVGAGYTGLWTAYYLKRHNPALSIVMLEADIAGYGASGRNGGWCSAYLVGLEKMLASPRDAARAVAVQRLMFDAVEEVDRACRREAIDCHYDRSGQIEAAVNPDQLGRLHEHVAFMHGLGFGDEDLRLLTAAELRGHIRVDGALGGMHMQHCAAIHPARLARGLAEAVERQGVQIHEQTAVVSIGRDGLLTTGGRVKAGVTVLATEGYTGTIEGVERKLIPLHSMMVATEPLGPAQLEATGLTRRHTFNNLDYITTYGQLTNDRRIAFGCRGSYLFRSRIRPHFDAADPEFELVRNALLDFFPALRGCRFTHAWGGAMGVSRSLNPAVCFDRGRGLGWAGGYLGEGVGATNLAGRTMADLVLARDTERTHMYWVNPENERRLDQNLWEVEPLRWLGIRSRAGLMHWADRAEHSGSGAAPLIRKALEKLFP